MRRHLVRWEQEYGERGLSLVEIEGRESEPLPIVRASVARQPRLLEATKTDGTGGLPARGRPAASAPPARGAPD